MSFVIDVRVTNNELGDWLAPKIRLRFGGILSDATAKTFDVSPEQVKVRVMSFNTREDLEVEIVGAADYTVDRIKLLDAWRDALKRAWEDFCIDLYKETGRQKELTAYIWAQLAFSSFVECKVPLSQQGE